MSAEPRGALFLDRDGVLVQDKGYMFQAEDLELLPGIEDFLYQAKQDKYFLIVITNQSGVARGYFSLEDVDRCHKHLDQLLVTKLGFTVDRYYVCPHHPSGKIAEYSIDCECRKPKSGLIEQALSDFQIDIQKSFVIGDKASDVDCGAKLGIPTIQIDGGQYAIHPSPGRLVRHLAEAMDWIKTYRQNQS